MSSFLVHSSGDPGCTLFSDLYHDLKCESEVESWIKKVDEGEIDSCESAERG